MLIEASFKIIGNTSVIGIIITMQYIDIIRFQGLKDN